MQLISLGKHLLTSKTGLAMRFTAILLTVACLQVTASGSSQTVDFSGNEVSLKKVFNAIEKQTGSLFFYDANLLKQAGKVSVNLKNVPLADALDEIFKDQPLTWVMENQTITIIRKPTDTPLRKVLQGFKQVLTISVTGRVTDESGRPLSSVSVVVPGTPLGSMTNANGEYRIPNVPENAKLYISYVGYESQTIQVSGRAQINVVLKLEIMDLDETVMIGYGTTSKRLNTGSVASVTAEEISKQPVANVLNALQGRVAGATINQANGLPGSRVTIQIRGVNSLNNGQQPLYIIDGVPFGVQDQGVPATNDLNSFGIFAANRGISPFSLINPADIERIDVLKDADATAIYGTRGANGVVLITTKKGKAGGTKIDVNMYRGFGKNSHYLDMMSLPQYLQMRRAAYANDGLPYTAVNAPDLLSWDTTQSTDWQRKYLGGTANISDVQLTLSGGDNRTRYLLSSGYHKETTVFPGDFNDARYTVRFSTDHNSSDRRFNASFSANYSYNKTNLPSTDLASAVYNLPPNMPLYKQDGSLLWNNNFTNPESYLLQNYYGNNSSLFSNLLLRYTLLEGLDLKVSGGFNRLTTDQNQQQPALSKNSNSSVPTNSARFATLDQQTFIVEPQAVYTKKMGFGKLTALLGGTFQQSLNKGTSISADNYSNSELLGTLSGAGSYPSVTATYTLYRYNSIFSRLGYDWKNKYLVNGVLRRDGSSRFGTDNRFGNFWSVGAGWIFSNEKWMADALPFLSFGKLRGSYGLTGSDQLQDYQFITLFSASSGNLGYQGSGTLSPNRINNPDLHWETNKKLEFGLDLGFAKDRVTLTANYYRNRTGNQLGFLALSSQSGFNAYSSNFEAVIQNTGWELELNTTNVKTSDFQWKTSFNLTVPTTRLLSASPQYFYYNQAALGKPLSYVLRYNYQGVDPQTGRALYRDLTKDSLTYSPTFSTDRSIVGYTAPKFYGGLNNTLSFKGFDLSFFFQFTKQEGNIYPSSIPGSLSRGNSFTYWLQRWNNPGDMTNIPKVTTGSDFNYGSSDAIWGDASFARLRNATLSYNFTKAMIGKIGFNNCRIYIQGQNLYTWTKNKYVSDPETISTVNQSTVVSTPLRVFTFGINCSF